MLLQLISVCFSGNKYTHCQIANCTLLEHFHDNGSNLSANQLSLRDWISVEGYVLAVLKFQNLLLLAETQSASSKFHSAAGQGTGYQSSSVKSLPSKIESRFSTRSSTGSFGDFTGCSETASGLDAQDSTDYGRSQSSDVPLQTAGLSRSLHIILIC